MKLKYYISILILVFSLGPNFSFAEPSRLQWIQEIREFAASGPGQTCALILALAVTGNKQFTDGGYVTPLTLYRDPWANQLELMDPKWPTLLLDEDGRLMYRLTIEGHIVFIPPEDRLPYSERPQFP